MVPHATSSLSMLDISEEEYYTMARTKEHSQLKNAQISQEKYEEATVNTVLSKTMTTCKTNTSSFGDANTSTEKQEQNELTDTCQSKIGSQPQQILRSPAYKMQSDPTFSTPWTPKTDKLMRMDIDTPDIVAMETTAPRTIGEAFQGHAQRPHRSAPSKSRLLQPQVLVPQRLHLSSTTHAKSNKLSGGSVKVGITATDTFNMSKASITAKGAITNKNAFNTLPSERVLGLERAMGYAGGAAALLYNGGMIAFASGIMIVLVDVRMREAEPKGVKPVHHDPSRYSTGLWKAFKSSTVASASENYPQAFLKAHQAPISLMEVSLDGRLMVSSEVGADAHLVLWDLLEGKRIAVLQPHAEAVHSVNFSPDSALLCTAGWDHLRRVQVIVWDIPSLVHASSGSGSISKETSNGVVVARQLSDFHISKIVFSPFEEHSLVSCGRENIRFWRTRKGHLPGRPVQLGEYSRGYVFTDVAYVNAPVINSEDNGSVNRILGSKAVTSAASSGSELRPSVFVASTMGLLLRVDCILEQVICAYQLHSGPIRSMSINSAYAVTGGDDCKLRIWPLQFTDFLMEAFHEAAVSHVFVSQDARLLTVGTSSGTLGVLDVFDHRYWTVLRSHVGSVLSVSCRPPVGDEFLTVGCDNTIRLWDALSGQQKFEFDSPIDSPLCGVYHPTEHIIACGFGSGTLRIFDVETTSTIFERTPKSQHASPLVAIQYSSCPNLNNSSMKNHSNVTSYLLLYTASLEGRLCVYDVKDSYSPLRSLSACGLIDNSRLGGHAYANQSLTFGKEKYTSLLQRQNATVQMSISQNGRLLAASCGSLYSLSVFDTNEMASVFKGALLFEKAASETHMSAAFGSTTSSMATTMGSIPRSKDWGHGEATAPVNALIFDKNEEASQSTNPTSRLFVITDKRIICIVITSPSSSSTDSSPAAIGNSYLISFDDISSRRLGVPVTPVPGAIAHDSSSGLFFVAAKSNEAKNCGKIFGREDGSELDCLLIVGAALKPTKARKSQHVSNKLSLTCSQVMSDLPGSRAILSISSCGSASNKIIITDKGGCVSIWHMREDRIAKLKDCGSPLESENYTPIDDADNRHSYGLHDLDAEIDENGNLEKAFTKNLSFDASVMEDTEQSALLNVRTKVKDCDLVTFFDYEEGDMTSAMDNIVDGENAQPVDSSLIDNSQNSSSHASVLKSDISPIKNSCSQGDVRTPTRTQSSPSRLTAQFDSAKSSRSKRNANDSSCSTLNQSFGSDSEYVGHQMEAAAFCSEHFSDDDSVLDRDALAGFNTNLGLAAEHAMTGKASMAIGEVLLQHIGSPPCYCPTDNTVVTCSGSQIAVENITIGNNISSAFQLFIHPNEPKVSPELDCRHIVRHVTYSPSGLYIAAVVDVLHAPLHSADSSMRLKSALGTDSNPKWTQAPSELHVWSRLSNNPGEGAAWNHLGEVTLYTAGASNYLRNSTQQCSSDLPATLSWTLDDSLVMLVAVPIPESPSTDLTVVGSAKSPAQSGALVSITNWADKMPQTCTSSFVHDFSSGVLSNAIPTIEMPGIPIILPFVKKPEGVHVISNWQGPPCDCAIAVWGDTKTAIFAINADWHGDAITPMWVKDIGRGGPLLSVHIVDYSHAYSKCKQDEQSIKNLNANVATSIQKTGGRSLEEISVVSQNISVEREADYRLTQRGVMNASQINMNKRPTKKQESSNLKTGCQCCDVIFRSYPLLLTLDVTGTIHCSRLTFPADFNEDFDAYSGTKHVLSSTTQCQPPDSCVVKVASAHVSGTPRTMTVSPCASILALGTANSIQIFNVIVKDIPTAAFSMTLTLRQKVVVPFTLDFLSYMHHPKKVASRDRGVGKSASGIEKQMPQVDLLCAAKGGTVGVVTVRGTRETSGKQRNVVKYSKNISIVRSGPPYSTVDAIVSLVDGNGSFKIAVLNRQVGEVSLLDGSTGERLMSRLSGVHSSYSLASCDTFLAVGSRCGRVSIYLNNDSMDLGQVVHLNATGFVPTSPLPQSNKIAELYSNVTIKKLSVVSSGQSVVALRMDNTLFIIRVSLLTRGAGLAVNNDTTSGGTQIQTVIGVKCHISVPLCLHTAPASLNASKCSVMKHEYHFVPCFGDDNLFGCVRGHSLHLYLIKDDSPTHRHSNIHKRHGGASSGKLPSSHLQVVRIASYRFALSAKDVFGAPSLHDYDKDINVMDVSIKVQIQSLHLVRLSGSTLQITVVGLIEKAKSISKWNVPLSFLLTGKVDMSDFSADAVKEGEIQLKPCFSLGKVTSIYSNDRDYLCIVGHDGVRLYDINNLHVTTRKILARVKDTSVLDLSGSNSRATCERIFNNELFEVACCRGVFQSTLHGAATISSRNWNKSAVTLTRGTNNNSCMAYVYSTQVNSPVMYRISFA